MEEKKIVCARDCYDTCSMIIETDKKGKLISIRGDSDHPITRGTLCPRGVKDIEHVYKNRILYPHKFDNLMRRHQRFSWEEALNKIPVKLIECLENYGSDSILHIDFAGNGGFLTWDYPLRFWNFIGAAQTDYSICTKSGHKAISLHYGKSYGIQPENLLNQKLIVFWGFNASESAPHLWNLCLKSRKKNNTKLVSIDPRETQTAKQSDLWINPYPGTDNYLAFGISKYLIDNDYLNTEFIKKWTYGFEKYKSLVDNIKYSKIEQICHVTEEDLRKLSDLYTELRPNASMIGIGLSKSKYGANSVRAISLIPALLGIHRGFFFSNDQAYFLNKEYLRLEHLNKTRKVISHVNIAEDLEKNNIKFIYIFNSNPSASLPNQEKFRAFLKRKEVFVVVHDTHWSSICDFGDIVLPAPTFFEKEDIIIPWSHSCIQYNPEIISPLGESKSEIWVFKKISEKLNLKKSELWEEPLLVIKKSLNNSLKNGSFEDLINGNRLELRTRESNKYYTPSKKIEFYSTIAKKKGINPLPTIYHPNLDSDEFILLTSSLKNYTHSQFQEIYGKIPPILKLNFEDAQELGIKDNMKVKIYNSFGYVKLNSKISIDMKRGVLWAPKLVIGLDGNPVNILTSNSPQKIGGGSSFNSTKVRLKKITS
ncbi:MAG: formate dehydrogenase [Promethearchaeota archaeon]|nr:MAG: formate dehydrogenase [Candidatus Lokiarchaeota archaeon]